MGLMFWSAGFPCPMWAPVIDEICRESQIRTVQFFAADAVDPCAQAPSTWHAEGAFSRKEFIDFDSNRARLINENKPRLVIVASRWEYSALNNITRDMVIGFLKELPGRNPEVLFIEDPPELAIGSINTPQFAATFSSVTIKTEATPDAEKCYSMLNSLKKEFNCVHTVQTSDLYLIDGDRAKVREGKISCILITTT